MDRARFTQCARVVLIQSGRCLGDLPQVRINPARVALPAPAVDDPARPRPLLHRRAFALNERTPLVACASFLPRRCALLLRRIGFHRFLIALSVRPGTTAMSAHLVPCSATACAIAASSSG